MTKATPTTQTLRKLTRNAELAAYVKWLAADAGAEGGVARLAAALKMAFMLGGLTDAEAAAAVDSTLPDLTDAWRWELPAPEWLKVNLGL